MSVALSSRHSLGNTSLLVGSGGEGVGGDSQNSIKSKSNKRYSTAFGTAATTPQTKDERKKQQDVAENYQGVVKRVQENKLTAKNAFMSRMFIDDLDLVLVQAKGSFHKASCAVSTAAEVYCLLVDDLSQSTTMVQELLFNNSGSGANASRSETDGEEARANRKRALGGGAEGGSGVSSTLETNLSNIRSEQVESELNIDAQFQKLLQGKDTGAEGMLLNILKVYDGPNLALDSACIPAFAETTTTMGEDSPEASPQTAAAVGEIPANFLTKAGKFNLSPSFQLGASFAELRAEADKLGNVTQSSIVETLNPRSSFDQRPSTTTTASVTSSAAAEEAPVVVEDYDYDTGGGFDGGDDDYDDYDNGGRNEESSALETDAQSSQHHQPTAVPFIMRAFDAQAMESENGKLETFVIPNHVLLEYQQEQQQRQPTGKVWLGFTHWKAPRLATTAASLTEGGGSSSSAGFGPALVKRQRKEVKKIDFFKLSAVNESLSFAKTSTQRLIQLPKPKVKSNHLLPVNTHFDVSDLQCFFLRPHQALRSTNQASLDNQHLGNNNHVSIQEDYGGPDADYMGGDGDGGADYGDDNDYDDGNDFYDREEPMHLVAPAHHVERIRVAYATRAKKVDVKQLKVDLWDTIDTLNPDVEVVAEKSTASDAQQQEEVAEEEVAKVSLSGSIRMTQEQHSAAAPAESEVITVPFYFICMLHLANEKGLELHSSQDLDDISIFRSTTTC